MGLELKITHGKKEINLTDFTIVDFNHMVEDIKGRNEFLARNVQSIEIFGCYSLFDKNDESMDAYKLECWAKKTAHDKSVYRKVKLTLKDNNDEIYDEIKFKKGFVVKFSEGYKSEKGMIEFYALIREFNDEILAKDGKNIVIDRVSVTSDTTTESGLGEKDGNEEYLKDSTYTDSNDGNKEYSNVVGTNPVKYPPTDLFSDFGFIYDPVDKLFYTKKDAWQRNLGYSETYDNNADKIFAYITWEKIEFKYAGKEWLIEIWKGTYLGSIGAEIGIYERRPGNENKFGVIKNYYASAPPEDELKMSFVLKTTSGRKVFSRDTSTFEKGVHWWLTAFKPGESGLNKFNVILDVSITLKDDAMATAFFNSINNLKRADSSLFSYISRFGNTVKFSWKRSSDDRWELNTDNTWS